jgi:CRISPR-associated helicase Cas3
MMLEGYALPEIDHNVYRQYWKGKKYPYPHQTNLLDFWQDKEHNAFMLTSQTGSGKTVAAALPGIHYNESSIFVYPTNALLEDQAKSIQQIIIDMGKKCYLFDGEEPFDTEKLTTSDYMLLVVNGKTLDKMKKQSNVRSKGQALAESFTNRVPMIIVTNPDMLFLLASMRYRESSRFIGYLQSQFDNLVVDEFHLYDGLELNHLIFLLYCLKEQPFNIYNRLVLLSATPNSEVMRYLRIFFELKILDSDSDYEGDAVSSRTVVQPLSLQTQLIEPFDPIPGVVEIMNKIVDDVKQEQSSSDSKNIPIPVVIILNSVAQVIRLENMLMQDFGFSINEIGSFHGLLNEKARDMEGKKVVVGTSAIEVGIDFHCRRLVFESISSDSFVQRLGRAGRHPLDSPGEVYYLYHQHQSLKELNEIAEDEKPFSRETLMRWAERSHVSKDSLSGFVESNEGALSAYSIFENQLSLLLKDQEDIPESLLNGAKERISELFKNYLAGLGLRKTKVRWEHNYLPDWFDIWRKQVMFRPGNYRASVFNLREITIKRYKGAYVEQSLYRVLSQGRGIQPISKNSTDCHFDLKVKSFGGRCPVRVQLSIEESPKILVADPESVVFYHETGILRSEHMDQRTGMLVYQTNVLRKDDIDWRIEVWEGENGKLIAFGGYALLLRWYERQYED